jgi:hypothetical protein
MTSRCAGINAILVVTLGAIVFSGQPADAAVLIQFNNINFSTDLPTGVVRNCEVSESSCQERTAIPSQIGQGRANSQAFSSCPIRALSAELGCYFNLASRTNLRPTLLPASPTLALANTGTNGPLYRDQSIFAESDNRNSEIDYIASSLGKDAACKDSFLVFCHSDNVFWVPQVVISKERDKSIRPVFGNGLDVFVAGDSGLLGHSLSQNVYDTPTTGGVERAVPNVLNVPNSGEYDLVLDCMNFTIRVVWFGETDHRQAVGSYDQFVLGAVDDYNSATRGADLGICRVWPENNQTKKHEFRHVILSSGSSSFAGFTSGPNHLHTCLGCTLLVSDDAQQWSEIIATQ